MAGFFYDVFSLIFNSGAQAGLSDWLSDLFRFLRSALNESFVKGLMDMFSAIAVVIIIVFFTINIFQTANKQMFTFEQVLQKLIRMFVLVAILLCLHPITVALADASSSVYEYTAQSLDKLFSREANANAYPYTLLFIDKRSIDEKAQQTAKELIAQTDAEADAQAEATSDVAAQWRKATKLTTSQNQSYRQTYVSAAIANIDKAYLEAFGSSTTLEELKNNVALNKVLRDANKSINSEAEALAVINDLKAKYPESVIDDKWPEWSEASTFFEGEYNVNFLSKDTFDNLGLFLKSLLPWLISWLAKAIVYFVAISNALLIVAYTILTPISFALSYQTHSFLFLKKLLARFIALICLLVAAYVSGIIGEALMLNPTINPNTYMILGGKIVLGFKNFGRILSVHSVIMLLIPQIALAAGAMGCNKLAHEIIGAPGGD